MAIHLSALVLLLFLGCGKISTDIGERQGPSKENVRALTDPRTGQLVMTPGSENAPAKGPNEPQAQGQTAFVNPKAAIIRPFFAASLRRPIESRVNPFRSNLAHFAPHVEVAEEEVEKEEKEEAKTPLEFYDVNSYKLVLIMSGTALAKALVVDPKGKGYIVQEGTKIGNRGGKVVSITATEVRIEEPGNPPIIKSLEPPAEEMEKELQAVQEY